MNEMHMTAEAILHRIRGRHLTPAQIKAFMARLDALPMDDANQTARAALVAATANLSRRPA